jgi:hypothetical protein
MENKDENHEILIKINETTEQLKNSLEYYFQIIEEISVQSEKSTLSQNIKSNIQNLRFILDNDNSKFFNFKRQFEEDLYKICRHEWIDDYIDGLNYECKQIIYCKKCKLTNKH